MSTLERALALAACAHAGQTSKAGEPYIMHVLRVMMAVSGPDERIVAMLHDVVEDSDITLEKLRAEGFSERVVAAVDALTKRPGETAMNAAARAKQDPVALAVKLADNADNSEMSRLPGASEKDRDRIEEYRRVQAFLLS